MALVTKRYRVRMKAGTAGTIDDPHRPEVADILGLLPQGCSWSVNEGQNTVTVTCDPAKQAVIALTHQEV